MKKILSALFVAASLLAGTAFAQPVNAPTKPVVVVVPSAQKHVVKKHHHARKHHQVRKHHAHKRHQVRHHAKHHVVKHSNLNHSVNSR